MHVPYPGEPMLASHDHDWADGHCQHPDCAAIVEPVVLSSIDLGQRTVLEGIAASISNLSFEVRSRTDCDGCRTHLIQQVEEDLKGLTELEVSDPSDVETLATFVLEEWEARADDVGILYWIDGEQGMYFIGRMP